MFATSAPAEQSRCSQGEATQGFQCRCGRVSSCLARENCISGIAVGIIDNLEKIPSTIQHFHAHPSVLITRAVIELETGETDAAILEVPARKPETGYAIVVVTQRSNPLIKRPRRYHVASI